SSSATRGEYRMAPNRKSFHESALNCCETTLHLYLVPGAPSVISTFSIYREIDFPTALEPVAADLIAPKHGTAGSAQILLTIPSGNHHGNAHGQDMVSKPLQSETAEIRQLLKNEFRSTGRD
ncbi:MAG: hypothetical protein DMG89_04095, partial [Acidobacteria bacterium]